MDTTMEMELALPHALSGRSANPFVRRSVRERLPDILESTLEKNGETLPEPARARVRAFAEEVRRGEHRVVVVDGADGGPDWTAWTAGLEGLGSDEVGWFFLENYAYRLMLRDIGYFASRVDPFRFHKREALDAALSGLAASPVDVDDATRFQQLVHNALWGNQVDLSHSSGAMDGSLKGRDLLVDDALAAWRELEWRREAGGGGGGGGSAFVVNLVLDNCGAELLNDLLLVEFLVARFPKVHVRVLAKADPVFVSDALEADVAAHVEALCGLAALRAEGNRLAQAVADGRITVTSHGFFNSPRPFWEAPRELCEQFAEAALTITKGDANYRRLIDDRMWPLLTPFRDVTAYWGASALLAIRTCKSPAAVGLPAAVLREPHAEDWLVNGHSGLVQLKPSRALAPKC